MQRIRRLLLAAVCGGMVWMAIAGLDRLGRSGMAGPVVRANLHGGIDATGLFYTEIDGEVLRPAGE